MKYEIDTEAVYECLTCFGDFLLKDGILTIQSETFLEFECDGCRKTEICGACGSKHLDDKDCDVKADEEANALHEYEVQTSVNTFAYIVVTAYDEEEALNTANASAWANWKIDTDWSSADTPEVRLMDGEGGYK